MAGSWAMRHSMATPSLVAVISQSFLEAPHMTDLSWQLLLCATVIRKDTWEGLPADVRPALAEVAERAGERLRAVVRESEARDVAAMKARGLRVVPVPLRDTDHFFNTFKYHHWMTLYETIIDYLKHDCGPGGL